MKSNSKNELPVALTVAGLDPSGGAGILADVRTFVAHGCFPLAAVTSLTFQNTMGVSGSSHQSGEVVRQQVLPLIADFKVAGAKTGMLPTIEVITEAARLFREEELPAPVVDPVMQATSGDPLIDDAAVELLSTELFPLARVVTPNIPEAERLTGMSIGNTTDMIEAARKIVAMGARAVLIKGGHLDTGEALDVLNDRGQLTIFRGEMIRDIQVHGSGCTLSAAIAACLARDMELEESVRVSKDYVTKLIRSSPHLGHGAKPLYGRQD